MGGGGEQEAQVGLKEGAEGAAGQWKEGIVYHACKKLCWNTSTLNFLKKKNSATTVSRHNKNQCKQINNKNIFLLKSYKPPCSHAREK